MLHRSTTFARRNLASMPGDRRLHREAGRYVVVGVLGCLVQIGSFALLVGGFGVHFVAAAVIAGLLALINNFLLNRHWTFDAAEAGVGRQAASYVVISAVLFGAQLGVLAGLIRIGCPKVPAEAFAVLAVVPINFVSQRHVAFRA